MNESDYRIYIVVVPEIETDLSLRRIRVFANVYKSKKAIAAKAHYPGPSRVQREIMEHHPWVKHNGQITLYWTGRLFVEKSEYDLRLENLQKRWLKVQAERDRKATVRDVLNFMNESRRNSVNSNVNANTKAGQNTSEGIESIDRCEGVK
jgi:hypothetical protein